MGIRDPCCVVPNVVGPCMPCLRSHPARVQRPMLRRLYPTQPVGRVCAIYRVEDIDKWPSLDSLRCVCGVMNRVVNQEEAHMPGRVIATPLTNTVFFESVDFLVISPPVYAEQWRR